MKQFISIVLLFSLISPLVLKVSYIAYFHTNQEAITAQFCENKTQPKLNCNGKCHLTKKLQSVDQNSNKNQSSPIEELTKIEISIFEVPSVLIVSFSKAIDYHLTSFTSFNSSFISSDYLSSCFHPPQA